MLVLTRRLNQSIQIGDDIVVTVLEVRGDQVRIGIEAPRTTRIHRAEILQQIGQENAEAARSAPSDVDAVLGLLPKPEPHA